MKMMNLKLTFEPSVTWIQLAPSRPQMAACLRPSRWRLLRYSPHDIFRQVLQLKIFRRNRNEGISDDHSIWCRRTESNVQKKWLRGQNRLFFRFNLKRFVQQRLRWFQRERESVGYMINRESPLTQKAKLEDCYFGFIYISDQKMYFSIQLLCFKIRTTLLQSVCKHKVVNCE